MHVVVLTHHSGSFADITEALSQRQYTVLGVSSKIDMAKRQANIAEFQRSVNEVEQGAGDPEGIMAVRPVEAKVLVAMMKIGNVGITLTAASRVYLYEPCLNPQMEVQAAGRIHRLGQTRPVLVKKLVFCNSVESSIVTLHEEIKQGRIQIKDGKFSPAAIMVLRRE